MNSLPANGDANGLASEFPRPSPPSFPQERNGSVSGGESGGRGETPPCSSRKRTGSSCNSGTAEKRVATKVCRICGDKAFSYNFNVITCESCKAFFRRNALKEKEIRCPFNQQCDINVVSRRFCQYCRLTKCFNEGMKKEWIMSDEARLEKKKRVQDNRERRMAEAKARDETRRQNLVTEMETDCEKPESPGPQTPQPVPEAPQPEPVQAPPPPVSSHPYYPPSVVAPPVSSPQQPLHVPSPVGPNGSAYPSGIIPTVVAPTQPVLPTSLSLPPQLIADAVPSVAVPEITMNGTLSNSMTASMGLAPLNSEPHVQSLLSVQAVAPPPAASLVNPELTLNELAQVAIVQQQQQQLAVVQQQIAAAAQQTHAVQVQQVVEAAIAQQQHQIEAAVAHAQQQQLVAAVAAATAIAPTSPQVAAAVAAATASRIATTPPQTLFQTNPAVVIPPQVPSMVTPSQAIVVPQQVSSVQQTAPAQLPRKEMIAVPRDVLQRLFQNYSNVQPRAPERKENSPPPPAEAPVKCECKCRCGRYPGETLIVDQVMMDLLENSTKQCEEGTSWIDRTDDEMTPFEKGLMSCISDDARNAAEAGGLVEDEEDLDMTEYDQDLLDEIAEAMIKTHKISAPDWVFTTGRNASDSEIIQEAIKATSIFCQEIGVFCKLSLEDQMIIIKVGCLGFMILNAARSFNFLTIGAAATNEIHDISIKLFKMFHSEWKSSDAIINVMCMLLLFDPDVSGIENVEGLDDEYDQYSLLMEKVMYQQYGNDRAKTHSEFNEVQALLRSVASSLSTLNELLDKVGTESAILAILDNRID
uniref:Nuclear receptor domain-containing protein n=1 Tax=Steinernema glaseri TaxID=37863 RepID=A0A1I8ARF5_9BILA